MPKPTLRQRDLLAINRIDLDEFPDDGRYIVRWLESWEADEPTGSQEFDSYEAAITFAARLLLRREAAIVAATN